MWHDLFSGCGCTFFLILLFGLWAAGQIAHDTEEEKRKERLRKAEEELKKNGIELPK